MQFILRHCKYVVWAGGLLVAHSIFGQSTIVWQRHAIDNSLKGADGVRFEDANGDGLADIVTGWEQSGLVRVYFNPGKDQVSSKWKYVTVGIAPNVEDAVLIDLDGDGAKDVISSSEGNTRRVQVHWAPAPGKNYSDSTLWKTEIFPATDGIFQWMYAKPMQIDGKFGTDLILAGKRDNGQLPQPYIGWLQAPENPRNVAAWKWIPLAKVSWVMSVLVSDINGDKLPDIVYSDRKEVPKGVKWLENPGKSRIEGPWKNHIIGDSTRQVLFMDLNDLDGDGREDAIVVTREDQIHFYKKLSDDGLQWEKHQIEYPEQVGGGKAVTVADVDQDGRKDLVISSEGAKDGKSGVYYLRYQKSVFDKKWLRNEISGPEGIKYDLVPAFDFDQDGDLDFVSTEENNNSSGGYGGLGIVWYENPLKGKQQVTFRRFENNPIIKPELLPGKDGDNINGPSLIRVPDWLPNKLGKYYLYFAHHNGTYIRLAYADDLKGPWKIYEPGTLKMDDCACKGGSDELKAGRHIASPDIHLDEKDKKIVMYFHCPLFVNGDKQDKKNYKQLTLRATSTDGIHFKPETTQLGESYFRVFEWGGDYYAISRLGILWRSKDGIAAFERGPNPFDLIQKPASTLRHAAVAVIGNELWVWHSRIADSPEQIYLSKINLTGDWKNWKPTEPVVVAFPEKPYEGAELPLTVSKEGAASQRFRELRDPAIFEEDGKWYLLYSVAAESGIAIGELTVK